MARRVTILKGDPTRNETRTALAITLPGMLIEIVAAGTTRPCTTPLADVARAFALERDELGRDIDTAYAVGDVVHEAVCYPGCVVSALIASGQNVAAGNYLEASAVPGYLQVLTSGARLARSLEARIATATPTRVRAEIV